MWIVVGEGERTYNRMKKKREGRRVEEILWVWWTLGRELGRIGGVRALPGGGLVIVLLTLTEGSCDADPQQIVSFVRNNV